MEAPSWRRLLFHTTETINDLINDINDFLKEANKCFLPYYTCIVILHFKPLCSYISTPSCQKQRRLSVDDHELRPFCANLNLSRSVAIKGS